MSQAPPGPAIARTAQRVFGYEQLRPGQEEAIAAAVAGRDVLAVLATGSGKSAIYQVAAVLRDGPTLVVSPLLALQRDQVERLDDLEAGGALEANSAVGAEGRRRALEELGRGDLEFLFLAPEQLANEDTIKALRAARPSLLVVDEAHCISSWGHDFRPDYLRIGAVAEELGRPPILALTATAAPPVRQEIVERLGMRDPEIVVRGFDRPNIHLSVEAFRGPGSAAAKREAVLERAVASRPPGLVYVATRRTAEEVTTWLAARDVRAAAYHAGMAAKRRDRVQDAFMQGDVDVMVATVAFGMGVDKPDVRFVLHHDAGGSLDSYHQEIGRAGRDGEPAQAVLFYRPEDLGLRRFFASGRIPVEQLRAVALAVCDAGARGTSLSRLSTRTGLGRNRILGVLSRLEATGAVAVSARAVRWRPGGPTPEAAAEAASDAEEAHRLVERSRVEMVQAYAETRGCRRQVLLAYFGEHLPEPCGHCDNCEAEGRRADPTPAAGSVTDLDPGSVPDPEGGRFVADTRVVHATFGPGQILQADGDRLTVLFDEVGYKTLSAAAVAAGKLLRPAG